MKTLKKLFNKKIFIIWLISISATFLIPFILAQFNALGTTLHTFKELGFGIWGYGWDGMHYIDIAQNGYHFPLQAFFPVYPLIIKFVNTFLPLSLSFRVNLVILYFLLLVLYKIQRLIGFNQKESMLGLAAYLLFPSAFFLHANYTETFFILVCALSLYFLLQKKLIFAIAFAAIASGTKSLGVSLVVPILYSYLKKQELNLRTLSKASLMGVAAISGFILYLLFLHLKFGSFTIFFEAQGEWGRDVLSKFFLLEFISKLLNPDESLFREILQFFSLAFAIPMLYQSFKKIPKELSLYSLTIIAIPLFTGSLLSLNRLVLAAFPLILYFGKYLKDKRVFAFYALTGVSLQLVSLYLFFNNVFVG